MKRSWLRTALLNTALVIFSFVMAVGLAEIAVRIVAPQQLIMIRPDLWQPADTVGWLRRANVNAEINTGQGAVQLMSDQDGFRIGRAGRSSGVPVLVLGDSFVEALQVEYEQSVSGLLEQSLSAATGQTVAVRNAGVGGWTPSQYYLRARSLLPRDNYRLVITAVYVGNDARPDRTDYVAPRRNVDRHEFRLPRAINKAELVGATLRPLNDALEVRSHLFIMVRKRLETLRMKTGTSPLYFPREFLKRETGSSSWTTTADICRDIKILAEQHGARALFVLIPTNYQVDQTIFHAYVRGFGIDTAAVDLDQPTRRLMEEFTRRDLQVIDALPRFRELNAAGQDLYGNVDQHLSAAGHQALSELVTPVAAHLLAND